MFTNKWTQETFLRRFSVELFAANKKETTFSLAEFRLIYK
jgi:hypothetical protein